MPVQDNATDCGVFMLIFLYHLLLMEGVNNFSMMAEHILKPVEARNQEISCEAGNMWSLRKFILKTILSKCSIILEQPLLCKQLYFI